MKEIHKHDFNDPVQTKKVPRLLSLDLGQALIFLWLSECESVSASVHNGLVTPSLPPLWYKPDLQSTHLRMNVPHNQLLSTQFILMCV